MDSLLMERVFQSTPMEFRQHMGERLSVTNLSSEKNLPTFRLNASVVIRVKVKEVQKNVGIYSHALLSIYAAAN